MVSPCPLIDNLPTGDGHLIGACLQPAVPYSPCNGNLVKHTFDEEESATVNYKWLEALCAAPVCSQVEEGNWKDRVLCSSDLCNCVTSAHECNGDTTVQQCNVVNQQCSATVQAADQAVMQLAHCTLSPRLFPTTPLSLLSLISPCTFLHLNERTE